MLRREQKKYHELFEVLKMRLRQKLGLPLLAGEATDGLSRRAADEAGGRLDRGLPRGGRGAAWPRGKSAKAGCICGRSATKPRRRSCWPAIETTDENYEDLIDVCLHEGIDIGRGYGLVLDRFGTCNAITTFDSSLARRPRSEQAPAAKLLLRRLHEDLVASVKADIARQEGKQPKETSLRELVHDRDWLFQDNSYHLDTTHLAATVRIARTLSDPDDLRLALDLTEYGRRLSQQFQYQGDEPFADMYPANALYFQALLGRECRRSRRVFQEQSRAARSAASRLRGHRDVHRSADAAGPARRGAGRGDEVWPGQHSAAGQRPARWSSLPRRSGGYAVAIGSLPGEARFARLCRHAGAVSRLVRCSAGPFALTASWRFVRLRRPKGRGSVRC